MKKTVTDTCIHVQQAWCIPEELQQRLKRFVDNPMYEAGIQKFGSNKTRIAYII